MLLRLPKRSGITDSDMLELDITFGRMAARLLATGNDTGILGDLKSLFHKPAAVLAPVRPCVFARPPRGNLDSGIPIVIAVRFVRCIRQRLLNL
jgi:hypothetical protein